MNVFDCFKQCLKTCFEQYAYIMYNINFYYVKLLYRYGPEYIDEDREINTLFKTQKFVEKMFINNEFCEMTDEDTEHYFRMQSYKVESHINNINVFVKKCNDDIFSTIIDELCIIYNDCYKNDDVFRILTNAFIRNISYTNGLLMDEILQHFRILSDKQKDDLRRICDVTMNKYIDIMFNDVIKSIINNIYNMNVITLETFKKYLKRNRKNIENVKTITVNNDIIHLITDNIRQIVQTSYKGYYLFYILIHDMLKVLRIIIKENCFGCITMDYRKFKEYFIVRT